MPEPRPDSFQPPTGADPSRMERSFAPRDASLNVAQARVIARDGYVFGFPLIDNYRIMHAYFADAGGPAYGGPWNQVHSAARVYTPDDTAIQSPNADTPYSVLGADLRAEPLVIATPPVEPSRFFSLQFIDLNTFNFAYAGSRTTGNRAGVYVLARAGWEGSAPDGAKLIRCETDLALVLFRTQLFDPDDLANVASVQTGYRAQQLSAFLGKPAPPPAPPLAFPSPLSAQDSRFSAAAFDTLDFVLSLCPPHPEDAMVRAQLARLGVDGSGRFSAATLRPELQAAVEQGIADAWKLYEIQEHRMATGELSSGDIFGTREHLSGNYLNRMVAAVDGIYGNSREEAIYPAYVVDADGRPIDTSLDTYQLRFGPGQLPPVNAFWSVTMYELPQRRLVKNPIDRYLINSPMLPSLKRDPDGGLTLYIQRDSPGGAREANWLPGPDGQAVLTLRLYWPKPEALDGRWKSPPLRRVG